ncbi:MAG: 2-amino-4-hydroxy-6-hydroxymethyldihydropteridine diphosphokinase [Saprospiraceae bacterium]
MPTYYLHLGSNQGDRKKNIQFALENIQKKIGVIINQSSIYETEAWGLEDQPHFLNMALAIETNEKPLQLMAITKEIEKETGRTPSEKWGPRVLDIDILYAENLVLQTDTLTIPHAGIYDRNFVLIPLIEIAGDFIDPVKQISIDELYDICTDKREVYLYEEE